jgi:hypothetical protein
MRLFKDDKYIDNKLTQVINNNFDCKVLNNIYNKIKLIKTIQTKYNINDFNVNCDFGNNLLTNNEYILIKNTFRMSRHIPTNSSELVLMYVNMIKNICGPEIIQSKKIQTNNERTRVYKYNEEHLDFHNILASYYSTKIYNLDPFDDSDKLNKCQTILLINNKIDIYIDEMLAYVEEAKIFISHYYFDH